MFKRVSRRQLKREKEDELGLDEEMKQVLGLQDTDSDESFDSSEDSESGNDSDLDSDQDEQSDGEAINMGGRTPRKRKRSANGSRSESDGSSEADDMMGLDGLYPDGSEDDMDDGGRPPMGVMAATTNPIYDVPGAPATQDLRACILCPGKLLKNAKMVKVHAESTAHLRRLQRYISQVSKLTSSSQGLITDDPRVILQEMAVAQPSEPTHTPDGTSKRSQRREAFKDKKAERRKAQKQRKAKKFAREFKEQNFSADKEHESDLGAKKTKTKESVNDKPRGAETVPVSITVDLPAPAARKKQEDTDNIPKKKTTREDPSSSANGERPAKRRKHLIPPAESSQADLSMDTSPVIISPALDRSKISQNKPTLKRHTTSLYFADDEKHPGRTDNPRERNDDAGKNREKKRAASGPAANRPSNLSRDQRGGHARPPSRGNFHKRSFRGEKDGERKVQKVQGQSTISHVKGKRNLGSSGKGLSAEQWGSSEMLKVFD